MYFPPKSHSSSEHVEKLSAASSFEVPSCPLEHSTTELDNSEREMHLSRSSSSSSSFARHSWTDLRADSNVASGVEEGEDNIVMPKREEEQVNESRDGLDVSGELGVDDSTLGWSEEDDVFNRIVVFGVLVILQFCFLWIDNAFKRNLVKKAIFGLLVVLLLGKFCSLWGGEPRSMDSEMNKEQLRAELDKKMLQLWEMERELASMKEKLESERNHRDDIDKELRKVHERLETDLRERIHLQTELEKTKAELTEAEAKMVEAERKADEKWMGTGFGELSQMYQKEKERKWLQGNLKETSEWWMPLYWRVVRLTFFKER